MMHDDAPDRDLLDHAITRELAALGASPSPASHEFDTVWRRMAPEVEQVVRGYAPRIPATGGARWRSLTFRVLAASLLLGAVARYAMQTRDDGRQGLAQHTDVAASARNDVAANVLPQRPAETDASLLTPPFLHAAALLEQVATDSAGAQAQAAFLEREGQQLLADIRALLDQGSRYNPATRALLADLEYVLVQVVQGGVTDPAEHALMVNTLTRRALVPRLRDVAGRGSRTSS